MAYPVRTVRPPRTWLGPSRRRDRLTLLRHLPVVQGEPGAHGARIRPTDPSRPMDPRLPTTSGPARLALLTAAALALLLPSGRAAGAQEAGVPDDTFLDPQVRELVLRAREARQREVEGISSYEGVLRERIYVGLAAARFRRERGLFEQERVARLRWTAEGERAVQWIGARRAIPIVGADTRRDQVQAQGRVGREGAELRTEMRRELPDELLRDADLGTFAFDPSGDRLAFGGNSFLNPLADTADAAYRFASGDTLRLRLPDGRAVVLLEVKVQPRRAAFSLVAGSLWFDAETALLVRATYRPARAFNLLLDEPEDAEDVPGFLQPVEAEISYVTVEYSLHEFRWWLPRRFAMEGEARLGRVVRFPLTIDWSMGQYEVNEPTSAIPLAGPLPPGWARREQRVERDGKVSYVTVVVPETEGLLAAPELSEEFGRRGPLAFSDQEVRRLRGELESLLPTYQRFRPEVSWGLTRGLTRYNRVEGLSLGVLAEAPLAPSLLVGAEARMGTGDRTPYGAGFLRWGSEDRHWSLSGYRRLAAVDDWSNPFSFTSSVQNLFLGSAVGEFYRAAGASLGRSRTGRSTRLDVAGFYERHANASRTTDFSFAGLLWDREIREVLPAEPVTVGGVRGDLRWFHGQDPNGLILTGRVLGEVAGLDARYRRGAVSLSAAHPLLFGTAGALEVGAGSLWGDVLPQRTFILGGAATLRGFDEDVVRGPTFWRARAELASGFAGARLGVFGDAAWAGPRADFTLADPFVAVGMGGSLLDGLLRLDLARGVRRGGSWRLHLYLDGLL